MINIFTAFLVATAQWKQSKLLSTSSWMCMCSSSTCTMPEGSSSCSMWSELAISPVTERSSVPPVCLKLADSCLLHLAMAQRVDGGVGCWFALHIVLSL